MFDRVLNTSYSVYWECYIFQTNQPKWNMALLWRLYRSRLTQQKKFGLQSLDFLCLLMQKQKSGFKLANCDLQINYVFWQITLSIFLWNLWIKAFLLWEFSEKLLFTLQALQFAYISKKIWHSTSFSLIWTFLSPNPNWGAYSAPLHHRSVATADLIVADHFWKALWCLLCLFISDIKGLSVFQYSFHCNQDTLFYIGDNCFVNMESCFSYYNKANVS